LFALFIRFYQNAGSVRAKETSGKLWTGHAGRGYKRWGRGGGGQRGYVSYGPQALDSHEAQDQNPHDLDGEAGSGAAGHL